MGGWVGLPKASLDVVEKRKKLLPLPGIRTPYQHSRYTNCTTPTPSSKWSRKL